MTVIRVDFIADLSCPWCYVAWHALERAIAARPHLTVERRWSAYLLRPDTPRHGIDRAETLARIYAAAPEKARTSRAALEAAALDAGVAIALDAARIFPATIDAHRLIHWAGGQDRMAAAVDALFTAYHVDGRDIGDPDVLVDIADRIGLNGKIVADLLRSEADWNAVADAHNDALEAGVRGVPVTIFNGRMAHQGAESVAGYATMLDRVVA